MPVAPKSVPIIQVNQLDKKPVSPIRMTNAEKRLIMSRPLPFKANRPYTGSPTSSEKWRMGDLGLKHGDLGFDAELANQRARIALGLPPEPFIIKNRGGLSKSELSALRLGGLDALQAFPGGSELASELERILKLQR